MNERLQNYLNNLVGKYLTRINLVCEMIILDFENIGLHSQCLTRIIKNEDILFTTYDYQSWDEKVDTHNDEWYFWEKYKDEIINGKVIKVIYNKMNDLTIICDNGVIIEIFISNGYFYYEEEQEQYRLLSDADDVHAVVYNKHIEFTDELRIK